jgi:hypothetical protein
VKRWQKILLVLVAIVCAAGYWLLADNRPGSEVAPLDIAAMRAAADSMPGEKPLSISVERAATGSLPSNLLVAGGGFSNAAQGVHAFNVNFKDSNVLIDTGFDVITAKTMTFYKRDARAQARVDAAIASAASIIVTCAVAKGQPDQFQTFCLLRRKGDCARRCGDESCQPHAGIADHIRQTGERSRISFHG